MQLNSTNSINIDGVNYEIQYSSHFHPNNGVPSARDCAIASRANYQFFSIGWNGDAWNATDFPKGADTVRRSGPFCFYMQVLGY